MSATKRKTNQRDSDSMVGEIAEQFEHAFLAGLGALSNAQKKGAETFDTLVKEGEKFRTKTSKKTESLIDDVQDAIRDMTDDAQSKATGLLDQVRDASKLDKLQSVFDTRVAEAMNRLNVPSKKDINAIDKKLNKILKMLEGQGKTASKKPRSTAKRKTNKKPAEKVIEKVTHEGATT
ncbi:MAG: phasin family protein [Gammaproteobacteria bacterium]|nr:phasin family protein [Gammaproteobacteria bacterium]MDH3750875.1 phasin family protein [Gammaproteobacteria bacterium]MDH3804565.1 phasin family protein [Gammaproteobacteria bacterium]